MDEDKLISVAGQFLSGEEIKTVSPLGEGFINDTFIIYPKASDAPKYLLQRKNSDVFTNIPGMMENISRVTRHLKKKIRQNGGNPDRESLTLLPARNGDLFFRDEAGNYWTLCLFIENHKIHEQVDTPEIACAGGKGIGRFQNMLADFEGTLQETLPGFHNIRYRFEQWDQVLMRDPVKRKAMVKKEISWIEKRRPEMLAFWQLVENGTIPKRITHNDTKISNILFDDQSDDALCMIDLDTVHQNPVLTDFGDAIRSYANTAGEDEPDLQKVSLNLQIYREFTRGYLHEASRFLTTPEVEYLPFSALYITFEQMLRFLMDYLDGDRYYKIKYTCHNLVRTQAQHKLLKSMEKQISAMKQITETLYAKKTG